MPPRSVRRVPVWRDIQTGQFRPPGTHGARPILKAGRRGVVLRHPPRRDARTGQYIPARGPRPRRLPVYRHPLTGRFITKDEAAALRRPSVVTIPPMIRRSPKARLFVQGLPAGQQRRFVRRVARWMRAGHLPGMALHISMEEFERGREYESEEQEPLE